MECICGISTESLFVAHNPVACDYLSVGPSSRLSRQTSLLNNYSNSHIFWRKDGLKGWRFVKANTNNCNRVVESRIERLCIRSLHCHEASEGGRKPEFIAWLKRNVFTGARSFVSGQMNSLGVWTKLEQRVLATGGDNAATEISFRPTVEPPRAQMLPSEKDQPNAGLLCPSITTVGRSTNIAWHECMVQREEKQKHLGQKGCVIWITGLSGSGKSTLACALDCAFFRSGKLSYVLDGDNVRHGLNNNLGFSAADRAENIRRIGEVAKLFVDAGLICIVSVISPYRKDRDACRQLLKAGEFIEVYMNFPLDLCEERDPKGLYKLARAGKIKGFTGVDDPYEAPLNCEVVMEPIDGKCPTPAEMASKLVFYLEENRILKPTL